MEENASEMPDIPKTRIVGLCTGLLAAAAVASARSISELLPLAVETVRLAFRTGACVGKVKDGLQTRDDENRSWSTIVTDMSATIAQASIDDFHLEHSVPTSSHAYVSAISTMAVTISGPPHVTAKLFDISGTLKNTHCVPIPIFAPFHAAHLFSDRDVEAIFDDDARRMFKQFYPLAAVHSESTGKCFRVESTAELMNSVIHEIVRDPVRWDRILEDFVTQIAATGQESCRILALGNNNATNSLASALKAGCQQSISIKDHTMWNYVPQDGRGRTQNDKIAIVGISGRFPEAASHDDLWELLLNGLDVHKEIPPDRFDAHAHFDASGKGKNKSHTLFGCFINEPGLFDPRFFNMSPREAAQTDPMGRLALVTAYEALEMSGYVPNRTQSTSLDRIGTFYGQTSDDWREINAAEDIDTYFITGGVRAFAPGRINYYFKFSGPSFSVDTACSSSTAAIQLACTSLWAGDLDMACAGGMNVLTNPDIFSGLSKGQFLSKTGSCKTFDDNADGYCRGDGVATVILKRYQDAIADKDHILGCILAAGTNHSAEAVSITHPHAGAQEFLYRKILSDAGVDAHDVSYVEMHGTGTQAGDGVEMTSVTNVFAPAHRRRRIDQPLHLGALKANIGHGEASSGISSMIKVLMMMRENCIPPNVGIKAIVNKTFPSDLRERNVHIPTNAVAFPRHGERKRKIFLNNFSAAGGNTAMLLEDPPARTAPLAVDPRTYHIITVTARAISSLKRNIGQLITYVDKHPDTDLSSLCYTINARRIQHNYRISFLVSKLSEVRAGLPAQIKDTYNPVATVATQAAFCFTGQGSQYTGIAHVLYRDLPSFRKDIHLLENIALTQKLPSFIPLITGSTEASDLSPVVVQLGMVCIQMALAWMWIGWGVKPQAAIGHSLGEYAALNIAGVLSASDVIHLVGQRAMLLIEKCTAFSHGMLAVKADEKTIATILGSHLPEIACKNGPAETVLCGTTEAMRSANETLTSAGIRTLMLQLPFAFHSAQVEAILDDFEAIARLVNFKKPTIPILSPLTGKAIHQAGIIGPEYLARHARETVDFVSAIRNGKEDAVFTEKTAWLEIGAHPICSGMVRASLTGSLVIVPSLRRNEDDWKIIAGSICSLYLAGVPVNFDEYHREYNDAHELLILPAYQFDNKNYWLNYHNNWTLTKGEAPKVIDADVSSQSASSFSTTSCQRIVREHLTANSGTVIFQTDLTDPQLAIAVSGHLVNNNPLCPSSLYADQALTIADYLYRKLRPKASKVGLNVCSMEVSKPLIAKNPRPSTGQHMQIEATADLGSNRVTIRYYSVTLDGHLESEHAHCFVMYEEPTRWLEDWEMTSYMVRNQIDSLKRKVGSGQAHKVLRGMAYKLFKGFVDYAPPYRGMSEVVFDAKEAEGTAVVNFQSDDSHGSYTCAPFWIDSLAHLSGFICNGTDLIDSDRYLYISHGWSTMRFARAFTADKTYESYVRMHPRPGNIRAGDVYIFEGEEIVGVVGGLKFQQLERRIMDIMLPPPRSSTAHDGHVNHAAVTTGKDAIRSSVSLKEPLLSTSVGGPVGEVQGLSAKAIVVIAEECEVDMGELVDDAEFDNLGVDSLLSLTISARLREELELTIPGNIFVDYPTIRVFREYLDSLGTKDSQENCSTTSDADSDAAGPDTETNDTATSTPTSISDDDDFDSMQTRTRTSYQEDLSFVRMIISEAMGIDPSELTKESNLLEMGMDSLMTLNILSELREKTGIDLSATFLTEKKTIKDIEKGICLEQMGTGAKVPSHTIMTRAKLLSTQSIKEKKAETAVRESEQMQVASSALPNAISVVLQGNVKTATKKLFLFPDGSGSATSYISIGTVSPDVCVLGLNCPFMKDPSQFTIGIEGVATLYLTEVKRRQAVGPYFIGGWSAGGVVAYEVCLQLLAKGDKVEKLILLDSPCPINLEPLPARLHHFFDEIGLLGSGGKGSRPDWLLPHFESTIKALEAYNPAPMSRRAAPHTLAVWATKGVCGEPDDRRPPPSEDEDPRPMKWLLDNRTDFGDNGWAKLLGDVMTFETVNANHFTMMTSENVSLTTQSSDVTVTC